MSLDDVYTVILAGGLGTRFWPLSRRTRPKQFLSFGHDTRPLLRTTAERAWHIIPPERTFVVTNEALVAQVHQVLPELPTDQVLAEPVRRNTAPCIGWAAAHIQHKQPNSRLAILPADHYIGCTKLYLEAFLQGLEVATHGDYVTIGIQPSYPETGYGYIEVGEERSSGVFRARRFIEKPNRQHAEKLIASNRVLWNSGMFFFQTSRILEAIERHLPSLGTVLKQYSNATTTHTKAQIIQKTYSNLPAISIDYGIMEKVDSVSIVPGSFEWSDLGSWTSAWDLAEHDDDNNVLPEDALTIDASGNLARVPSDKVVVLIGVHDLILVDSDDAVLIVSRDRAQDVRHIVSALQQRDDPRR